MTPSVLLPFGIEVPFSVVVLGSIIGVTYGLLAAGIVLVYRSNRIINFAHGETGAFGAALFGLLTVNFGIPYYLALPVGLGAGAATAGISELAVIRRLRKAPRLMSIVATLGVGQFLVVFSSVVNSQAQAGRVYPQPPGLPRFRLGGLLVTQAYTSMLLAGPVVILVLTLFLRRSRFGLAIRAAAANPDAARVSGVFATRMSTMIWIIAGGISALTAILVAPTRAFTSGQSFGPSLLLRALVGAVLARMTSLPRAMAAGIGLGVVEQVLVWNYPTGGVVEIAMFAIILIALTTQRLERGREAERGSWAAIQTWRPIPDNLLRVWTIRHRGTIIALPAVFAAATLPLVVSNSTAIALVGMIGFAIVGLSVGIVTGLGGQLSLGQFALAAIGATISFLVTSRIGNFPLGFLYAGLAAGLASLLIGAPALRIRGPLLTVTTLAFALATPTWLLQQSWMLGAGVNPGRPIIGNSAIETGRSYYYVALAVLGIAILLARNVRRAGFSRLLVAVRDNEDNARAFAVRAPLVKIQGFILAGFLAGIGGAAYAHAFSHIGAETFPVSMSIDVVVMTVVGGLGLLSGPLLGVLFVIGLPAFVPLDAAGLAATKLGLLILILYFPGGIGQKLETLRNWLVRKIAGQTTIGVSPPAGEEDEPVVLNLEALASRGLPGPVPQLSRRPLLVGDRLTKSFGGVRAVNDVSLKVKDGEIVGLIGPNGAGKTTLFELLGGFQKPDSGYVVFDSKDVTRDVPEDRAQLGLIRSFQEGTLFPTLTVLETLMLALERLKPTGFLRAVAGLTGSEKAKRLEAREIIHLMGLGPYQHKQIQELSTGTRRICELACLVALRPRLLLLDEPSSGIAQRETEALGNVLLDIKRQLQTTLVIIEHDIPLVMGLSTRVLAMDGGRIIAAGSPEQIRDDPLVVASYLGTDATAVERSNAALVGG